MAGGLKSICNPFLALVPAAGPASAKMASLWLPWPRSVIFQYQAICRSDQRDHERLSQAIRQRLWTIPDGAYLEATAVVNELVAHFPGVSVEEIHAAVQKHSDRLACCR